jgi:hypothetical protein
MEAVIRIDQPLQVSDNVNWMPFGIAHDGPCNAAEYFAPTQEQGVRVQLQAQRVEDCDVS